MTELTTFHFVVVQQVCRNCCNLFSLAVDPLFMFIWSFSVEESTAGLKLTEVPGTDALFYSYFNQLLYLSLK